MTIDHRLNHLETVRGWLSVVVYPIQYAVDAPFSGSVWLEQQFTAREQLLAENARLRHEHLLLESRLQKLDALSKENQRLRELMKSSVKVGDRVLVAELLEVDMDPYRHQLRINKGSTEGVYLGQPVLDAQGVMGQIIHVTPLTSTVLLISDPSHAIPVYVSRNGLRTIAQGTGSLQRLELPHLPTNADIRPGDKLITSGLGGLFPPDYPVAEVSNVQINPGQEFAQVEVRPSAMLEQSREVLLVWSEEVATETPAEEAPAENAEDAGQTTEQAAQTSP